MLKASALYIVIIVSLVIAIISGSLISTAYYYRLEYQKNLRYTKLLTNLNSGFAILLSKDYQLYDEDQILDLFGKQSDSLMLRKERWGVFDLALVKSYAQSDLLEKAFFIGKEVQNDKSALYLKDEDRPLSISGTTRLTGDAFLPKAGIKQAYVEGKAYKGDKLVNGTIRTSKNALPGLNEATINTIQKVLAKRNSGKKETLPDSMSNSFFQENRVVNLSRSSFRINDKILKGKITLVSDTIVRIGKTSVLEDVTVYAPAIVVESGFTGSCQLFATDSILIGKNCTFNYPSCLGVLRPEKSLNIQPRIALDSGTVFSGILLSYEKEETALQTLISLGKNSQIKGEIYAVGLVKMENPVTVYGKVVCNRFIIQTEQSLYENYLIDIVIDRKKRSPYYLSSGLFLENKSDNRILKWVN